MRSIKFVLMSLLVIFWLGSCASLARHNRRIFAKQVRESLVYLKDSRTGLCYAAAEGVGMVLIPCEKMPKR